MKKINTLKNETLLINRIIRNPLPQHIVLLNNHFNRYNKAIDSLKINKNNTVIDASCGLGYGTYILSQRAKKVIGLDVNKNYLKFARTTFPGKNIVFCSYRQYKKFRMNADKIVCIETYEHINTNKISFFIKTLLSYLKNGGDMFLTTTLGKNIKSSYNQYHLNEPSIEIVRKQFVNYFDKIHFEIKEAKNSYGYVSKYCYVILRKYHR